MKDFSKLFMIVAVLYIVSFALYYADDKYLFATVNGAAAGMFIWISVKCWRRG